MTDALSADGLNVEHPRGVRRTVAKHPAEELDLFAAPAANSRDGLSLLDLAERCANAILDAQGSFTVGEVREALGKEGLLANDGKEKLDALGALGRRLDCVVCGVERMSGAIGVSHQNRQTRWCRPSTLAERQAAIELVK